MADEPVDKTACDSSTARGFRRVFLIALGMLMVGLAVLGVVLPILPTTPFLLLASFFFVRSSPALNAQLLRSRLFGPLLLDWQEKKGIRMHVKATAVGAIVTVAALSAWSGRLSGWMFPVLAALASIGLYVVLRLPTVED